MSDNLVFLSTNWFKEKYYLIWWYLFLYKLNIFSFFTRGSDKVSWVHNKTIKQVAQVIIKKNYVPGQWLPYQQAFVWEDCNNSQQESLQQDSGIGYPSDEVDSERPYERYLHQAAERGEITLLWRSQPWIRRLLKLILTLRKYWRPWTLAVCPTCRLLSLQLGWISKHHVELSYLNLSAVL